MWTPPGGLTDLDAVSGGRAAWDAVVSGLFASAAHNAEVELPLTTHGQFVDAVHDGADEEWTPAPIVWKGFPKVLLAQFPTAAKALAAADDPITKHLDGRVVTMRRQDEYLEWRTTRDAGGRILAVDFTCESPEYWQALAAADLAAVTALYQEFVDPAVRPADLVRGTVYDPMNKWNTEQGAMHLNHTSNRLEDELVLAAKASVLREQGGVVLTDPDLILRCGQFGDPQRASDPVITGAVAGLAASGALVSLLDPVGVYIDALDTTGWTTPDGSRADDCWTVTRGTLDFAVRARFAVPADRGFVVSDVEIGGQPIRFAGQIAQKVTMRLTGASAEEGEHVVAPLHCPSPPAHAVAPAVTPAALVGGDLGRASSPRMR